MIANIALRSRLPILEFSLGTQQYRSDQEGQFNVWSFMFQQALRGVFLPVAYPFLLGHVRLPAGPTESVLLLRVVRWKRLE